MIDNTQKEADRLHKKLITACKDDSRELAGKLKPWEQPEAKVREIVESTSPARSPKF